MHHDFGNVPCSSDESNAEKWENTAKDIRKSSWTLHGTETSSLYGTCRPTVEEVIDALWKVDFEEIKKAQLQCLCINRGILSQQEASKIPETYLELRNNPPPTETNPDKKYYAEWVTLYPSYVNSNAILYPQMIMSTERFHCL